MARSWEYSSRRRTVMQAVMWLIFAATVGGAVALSHARSQATRVLLGTPIKLSAGRQALLLQLPRGWYTKSQLEHEGLVVAAREQGADGQFERALRVTVEEFGQTPPTAAEYLMSRTAESPVRVQAFNFSNLGAGTLMETPGGMMPPDAEGLETRPALFACVIVPASRRSPRAMAVVVELQGPISFGSSNIALLQAVADSIAVVPDKADRTGN